MDELLRYFTQRYLPRKEIVYRLPVSENIASFWPKELAYRKEKAVELPLHSWDGKAYWFYPTADILEHGDSLAHLARTEELNARPEYVHDEGVIDEAFYSSVIEGAYSTRQRAHEMILEGGQPKDKDEKMIINNYRALRFISDELDAPISHEFIQKVGRILTEGTMETGAFSGYRDGPVHVVSGRQEIVYEAPDARYVRGMMDELVSYIADPDIQPVIKACVTHIYFVTVHPFFDGNGRTARALALMILLQAGYDFFRQVPISGLLAEERSRYYKAVRLSQDPENGYDLTYFLQYYIAMLSGTTASIHTRIAQTRRLEALREKLPEGSARERMLGGAAWMMTENITSITAEKWRTKFGVSFETARQDLTALTELGFLTMRTQGRKHFYDIV